jgi:hypothetical protein
VKCLIFFSCFKAQAENLLSHNIKSLRTDGGTEYLPITKQFPHIIHQTTCPYTPEQNGLAERKHRHIIELALAIMSRASLPPIYWDEIFSSVVYLINRLPSPSNSGKIPYTYLFHKSPDYSLLRVLGCQCFPYTRPYNSHKLENHALSCLFLGYATTQKGYRCLHLPTKKIYISRHVQFDEHFFPFKPNITSAEPNPSQPNPLLFQNITQLLINPYNLAQISPGLNILDSSTTPGPNLSPIQPLSSNIFQPVAPFFSSTRPTTPTSTSQPTTLPPVTNFPSPPDPIPPIQTETEQHPDPAVPSHLAPTTLSTHSMVTRTRDHTRRVRTFPDHVAFTATIETEPTSFLQANSKPEWRHTMANEMNALTQNNTWTLVPPHPNQQIIGCKWVYKIKRRANGTIDRYKARLVAK